MPELIQNLPAILSALTAGLAAWFSYNQYTKNKQTDAKIERWKADEEVKNARRSDHIARIYGEMWQLLHGMQADRVYILQPHPLTNSLFLSISLEVKRNGISPMKGIVRDLPMSDVAAFTSELRARDFLYYRHVDTEVRDKRARAILTTNGSASAILKRLSDDDDSWIGSLFLEFTHELTGDPSYARKELADVAERVQYILPEYR